MMAQKPVAPRQAINDLVRSELGASAAPKQTQLSSVRSAGAATQGVSYKVQVPAGVAAGQPFIAQIPGAGQMLVQVCFTCIFVGMHAHVRTNVHIYTDSWCLTGCVLCVYL
jgi:hypothetical protein